MGNKTVIRSAGGQAQEGQGACSGVPPGPGGPPKAAPRDSWGLHGPKGRWKGPSLEKYMAPDPHQWVWCGLREGAPREGHSAKPPPDALQAQAASRLHSASPHRQGLLLLHLHANHREGCRDKAVTTRAPQGSPSFRPQSPQKLPMCQFQCSQRHRVKATRAIPGGRDRCCV